MDPVSPTPLPAPQPIPVISPPTHPKVRLPFLIVFVLAIILSGSVIAYTQFGLFQPARPTLTPQPLAAVLSPTPPPEILPLTLTSPKSGETAVNEEILIKGQTAPNITVIIYSETDETVIQSDASGNFEGTILLAEGTNSLVVTAYGDTGEEKSANLDIVYNP